MRLQWYGRRRLYSFRWKCRYMYTNLEAPRSETLGSGLWDVELSGCIHKQQRKYIWRICIQGFFIDSDAMEMQYLWERILILRKQPSGLTDLSGHSAGKCWDSEVKPWLQTTPRTTGHVRVQKWLEAFRADKDDIEIVQIVMLPDIRHLGQEKAIFWQHHGALRYPCTCAPGWLEGPLPEVYIAGYCSIMKYCLFQKGNERGKNVIYWIVVHHMVADANDVLAKMKMSSWWIPIWTGYWKWKRGW